MLLTLSCMKWSVCMCVKQHTDCLYIIICNCICIGVINCGWKNNVVVQIVACLNFYIYIHIYIYVFFFSRLDRHGDFFLPITYTLDVSHSNAVLG